MTKDLSDLRNEYKKHDHTKMDVDKNPLKTFDLWFNEAREAQVIEPNAMSLATVSNKGIPSNRIVLLKGIDKGFVFYTNYQSNKGHDLEVNPVAALNFFWPELERQVRIQGQIEKVSEEQSTKYFQSRPKESQIGAWASPQSSVIKNREILEQRAAEITNKYKSVPVLPKPKQWGGYRLLPFHIEFWQGRPSRLHDRITYTLANNEWVINRLAP